MKREHNSCFFHFLGKQAVSLYHNNRITCLKGDNDIIKFVLNAHPEPFHDSFLHSEGSVAVEISYPLSERAVVKTDTDSSPVVFANLHKLGKEFTGLVMILMEVSRIDTDLLYYFCNSNCNICREVYIGHKGRLNALVT